ncbi:hypothetical protein [Rhodoblastus sp.]|jgi:hypothetical protein|uniref:hypothetical protein n=1 Tax=Rhodoblastus sp. TaxID=1962975 RepID=UPI00263715DE|nr:hypothetical protein [Rhodoblastus sp.]
MSWTLGASFGLVLAGAAAALAQLWLRVWEPDMFVRIIITDGVFLAVVVAWHLIQRERRDTARLRDRTKSEL